MFVPKAPDTSVPGPFTERAKRAVARRVYIFKKDFVQESGLYSCAAVFSLFNSLGGKALMDR